jgi:hypothetical protein
MDKPEAMWKYSFGAFAAAIIINLSISGSFKNQMLEIIIVAGTVGALVSFWFNKSVKRMPTHQERSRFLWQYSFLIALPFSFIAASVIIPHKADVPGLLTLLLLAFAYPCFAGLFLKQKTGKNTNE